MQSTNGHDVQVATSPLVVYMYMAATMDLMYNKFVGCMSRQQLMDLPYRPTSHLYSVCMVAPITNKLHMQLII